MRTFSLDVLRGPSSWYMVVSPFGPRSSQYTFGCLSPSDWEKGKNWKRLPFSGVWQKTTFSPALSALKNRFLKWGFQYQTLSILSPSGPIPLGKRVPKIFGNFFLLPLQHFESPHQTATSHQRISPKPVGQKKCLTFIESDTGALKVWTPKYFEAVSFDRGLFTHYVWWKLSIDES